MEHEILLEMMTRSGDLIVKIDRMTMATDAIIRAIRQYRDMDGQRVALVRQVTDVL